MKDGDDSGSDSQSDSLAGELSKAGDVSEAGHTVTEIPDKTAHRQRHRRSSGAHLSSAGLPLAEPGHYDLKEEVARGGLGRIVAAFDNRLGRQVALKELVVRHPVSEARFSREAKLTASLQHPAIIPVHDAGVWENGHPFYAMKLVDGRSLASAIAATHSFEDRIAMLSHVLDVADAMAYAHSQRIIHRDLKPANILVGSFGETVVIDWGLAKHLDQSNIEDEQLVTTAEIRPLRDYETSEGAVLGTPAYMPPEQARGESVDERADVYALGALLYHLLAGKRPYFEVPGSQLIDAVVAEEPTALAKVEPEVPADLQAIVSKAMARSRSQRYVDAGEFADELRKFTTGKLVGAYSYSSKELFMRFVRQHRRVLVTAAAFLSILFAYGVWSFVRITFERNRAEDAVAVQKRLTAEAEEAKKNEQEERGIAEAKTRELRVSQARLLLKSDPTAAVAILKELGAPEPGAASIVAEAQELGIARHVFRSPELAQIRAVAIHQDVVAWSDDGGNVAVYKGKAIEMLPIHGGQRVPALALTDDGRLLASGGYDGRVKVTRLDSLESKTVGEMRGAVLDVAVSPDGTRIAAISAKGVIALWPLAGGDKQEWTTVVGRAAFIRFSRDSRFLVSGPHGNTALVIDLAGNKSNYLTGHTGPVNDAVFSPDGSHVATASSDGSVRVWTVAGAIQRALTGHSAGVRSIAFSKSGDFLASGDMEGVVRLAPWRSGRSRRLGRHDERVTRLAFALEDEVVVSVSWDKTARMFSVSAGAERVLRGHSGVISSMAISADGKSLVTGSWDTSVRVWNLSSPLRRVLSGHRVGVKAVAFSPDGNWVASGAHDNEVRLWDAESGQSRIYRGHRDHIFRVAFSPDGAYLASSSDDQSVRLWDLKGTAHRVLRGHRADVEELAWSANGEYLVSGAEDNTARVWPVRGGDAVVLKEHVRAVNDVAFSPDGRFVSTASLDGSVRLWPTEGGAAKVLKGHEGGVLRVAYLSDSQLVSLGADNVVRVWSLPAGRPEVVAKELVGAAVMAVERRSRKIAVGGFGGSVWICSVDRQGSCRELRGHVGKVSQVAFSPDGSLLASAGVDNSIRIWDVASGEHRVLYGHSAPVFDVAFSPDGRVLASGSGDGTVRLWNVRRPPLDLQQTLDELTSHSIGRGE